KGAEYLAQMEARGVAPAVTNAHMQFSVAVSTSYFLEIAKLRALRVLWANVLAGYGLTDVPLPKVAVHQAMESQEGDVHTNMIKAATQAMAAATGGADLLFIVPANHARREPSTPFTRRIARNVQHLLQLESRFTNVIDPAAGSYYLEKVTTTLAEKAWARFQQVEAQGGFLEFEDLA
ncbi:MAG: hypothetical protein KDC54_20325, partial [Lewinella sp.]|nr:hypothetical protein [Lewinella sp.]